MPYYDQKVTVRAEFARPDALVITPALSSMIPEDEIVTVTGTVRAFVDADFRRNDKWNWWGDMDTDIILTFRDRLVIVVILKADRCGR